MTWGETIGCGWATSDGLEQMIILGHGALRLVRQSLQGGGGGEPGADCQAGGPAQPGKPGVEQAGAALPVLLERPVSPQEYLDGW